MLSVPSPAANTWDLNIAAIPSAPSAIRATTTTRTRFPPSSSGFTSAGKIPVMRVLLGLEKIHERAGVYAGVIQITGRGDPRHTRVSAPGATQRPRPAGKHVRRGGKRRGQAPGARPTV